jgi:hypothetical protein
MRIFHIQDSLSLDCTHEELVALKNLCEFCAMNGVSIDTLYEMVSGLLRPKIIISHTPFDEQKD